VKIGLLHKSDNLALAVAAAIGTELAKEASGAVAKEGIKQLLANRKNEKDPFIFFGLFCDFKRLTSLEVVNLVLNDVLARYQPRNHEINFEKQTFRFDFAWQEFTDEDSSAFDWDSDALADEEQSEIESLPNLSESSSGFILWLVPLSQGSRKEITVSAYLILDAINRRLLENTRLNVRKITSFAYLQADRKTCLKVDDRLRKRMKKERLTGNTLVEATPNNMMLLTVPLREQLMAQVFADSFKLWSVF
jgi:hypothetical protein